MQRPSAIKIRARHRGSPTSVDINLFCNLLVYDMTRLYGTFNSQGDAIDRDLQYLYKFNPEVDPTGSIAINLNGSDIIVLGIATTASMCKGIYDSAQAILESV